MNQEEHLLNIEEISKYPSLLAYICEEKIYISMVYSLQYTILNTIKEKLEDASIEDNEVIGHIRHFTKPSFDHSTKSNKYTKYIKLFELITGKILDKVQYNFILQMFEDDEKKIYTVCELLMGRGKTSIIIPCTMFCCMMDGTYYNIINCLPTHLVNQSIEILNKLSPFLIDGIVVRGNSGRKSKMNGLLSKLINLPTNKIVCMDDTCLKTYLLSKRVEDNNPSNRVHGIVKGGATYIKFTDIQEIIEKLPNRREPKPDMLCDDTLILFDEFDSMIDPLKSDLNYPYNDPVNMHNSQLFNKLVVYITEQIFAIDHPYMLYDDRTDDDRNKLLIRYAMNKKCENDDICKSIHKIYNDVLTKINKLREEKKEKTIDNLTDIDKKQFTLEEYKSEYFVNNMKGGSLESLLMFYVREVYQTYIMCMKMLLDKDYGWNDKGDNPFIVIPYSAQKTPMEGSQFSDPIINTILTSIAYFAKPFRYVDSAKIGKHIRDIGTCITDDAMIRDKGLDNQGIVYARSNANTKLTTYLNDLKKDNNKIYFNYLRMYLEEVIFIEYIKVSPDIYNCSFIDVIDPNFIKSKFALSGTVNVHLPSFGYYGGIYELKDVVNDYITKITINKVIGDNSEILDKDGKVVSITVNDLKTLMLEEDLGQLQPPKSNLLNEPSITHITSVLDTKSREILSSIINLFNIDVSESTKYNVLIDVGSFLRNYENRDFALIVSCVYPDRRVVYFDENDQPQVLNNKINEPFNKKDLKSDFNTIVIFDQKHTVGTDLDLHSNSHAILTVNNMTTRTQLVQGVFRLREADLNQKITYLAKDIKQNTTELLHNVKTREFNIREQSKIKYHQQTILCLLRKCRKYSKESYEFKSFIPSNDLTDEILVTGTYNHNYKKDYFKKCVIENLAKCVPEDEEIKTKINDELKKINDLSDAGYIDKSVTIQKQQEKTYQIAKIVKPPAKKLNITSTTTIPYNIILNPELIKQVEINFDANTQDSKMMDYMTKTLKIQISPSAALSMCKTYQEFECIDLFYLKFINQNTSENGVPKAILYATDDILLMISQNKYQPDKLIAIDKFKNEKGESKDDIGWDDKTKSFYQNFIMFMFFKIPDKDTIHFFATEPSYILISEMLGEYYKKCNRIINLIPDEFAVFLQPK